MEPRYYIGEVVYLHPGIMPRVGDFVLTKLKAGLVAVVRIAAWDDETVTFEMLNHPDRTCVRRRDEIEFIHRIVGSAG